MRARVLESVLAGAQRHARAVLVGTAVAAVIGVVLVTRVSFDPNVLRLLPQDSQPVRSFETFLTSFGSLDHLYVVFEAPDGAIDDHRALVDAYADLLRRAPEVESVDAQLFEPGRDWNYLFDRELYLLGPSGARRALSRFRPPALDAEIAHARDLLTAPSETVKSYVQQDPLGLLGLVREQFGRQKGFGTIDPSREGYVSADGSSRLLIVKPKGEPFDTDFCKSLFSRLAVVERDARAAVTDAEEAAPRITIQAAGAYRVSLESEALIRREAIVNSAGSMLLLLAIVFALFRTPRVMLYGAVPLTLAALLALGVAGLVQGRLSPATSGSAGMLFGLGIDGVIVLYVRFLEEREHRESVAEAVAAMAPTAWSVILAQTTTAATFFALLLIDFPTLQDLGALVGGGILFCCAATLLLLPAFLARPGKVRRTPVLRSAWLGRFVTRQQQAILWVALAATVLLGAAATRLRVDTAIDRLQAQTRGTMLERTIADRFSLPRDILVVLGENESLEPLLTNDAALATALSNDAAGVSVSGISSLLPPASAQDAVAREIASAGLSVDTVNAEMKRAGERAGFRPDAFAPFVDRARRILDPSSRITYDGLLEHGLAPVVSRFVVHTNGRYRASTYLYASAPVDLGRLADDIHRIDPALQLTGVPVINRDIRERFPPQFVRAIAIGGAAVTALVLLVFRSIRDALLVLVPTAVGFVWSAGILALARVELDLFSIFAAVCFIGIAVDYAIYVLYRYAVEASQTMEEVLTQTGAAIITACLTALVGFGTLVNSSYQPLRVFGIVSLVTLTCCLIASLMVLPALVLQMERWSTRAR